LNSWISNDLDLDGLQWNNLDASAIEGSFGAGSLVSFSYDDNTSAAVAPDNLITSPLINLTGVTASNVFLQYNFLTSSGWPEEHYAVYVTTTNVASSIITTSPIFETTVATGGIGTKSINLSSFIGQNVYISFRHFDCFDKYYLILDNIEVKTLPNNDIQLVSSSLNRYGLVNSSNTLGLNVKNNGGNTISNITVDWNDGASHSVVIPISILPGDSATINHPTLVQYSNVVEKNIAINITSVNGVADANTSNNSGTKKFNSISQASPKKVLFEEGTGTWCGWCPRGAVAMDYMQSTYPNDFIGVAVHNNDPMTLTEYDSGAAINGFPGMNVDRVALGEGVGQSNMVSFLNARKVLATPVAINAYGNVVGSNVTINAYATFRTSFANANFRLGVIISEDDVTGTTSGYNQTNYYSGGAQGVMGGFETKPNPVPAAQMVYNHVGRALLGGYTGQAGSIPSIITDGLVSNFTFNYTIPASSTVADMHAVIVVIDQATGEVVNAKSVALNSLTLGNETIEQKESISIYPNPTSDFVNISNLKEGKYTISIFDMLGKLVQSYVDQEVIENQVMSFPVNKLSKGIYMINIASGTTSYSKQIIIE